MHSAWVVDRRTGGSDRRSVEDVRVTRRSQTFLGDASAPGRVRRFLGLVLEASGHGPAIPDAQLLASEVVTNAVIHTTCPDCRVEVVTTDSVVRVSVTDGEPARLPVLTEPDPHRSGGRGLQIVDHVARGWGCDVHDSDKTVWFELADPAAT